MKRVMVVLTVTATAKKSKLRRHGEVNAFVGVKSVCVVLRIE